MACNITPYSFSLSRSGIPRSLNVSDNEMIGVIEFIISWVNTRINFCQASISLRSNTEWMFFRLTNSLSLFCAANKVHDTAISTEAPCCRIRTTCVSFQEVVSHS